MNFNGEKEGEEQLLSSGVFNFNHKPEATGHVINKMIIGISVDFYVGHLRQNFAYNGDTYGDTYRRRPMCVEPHMIDLCSVSPLVVYCARPK